MIVPMAQAHLQQAIDRVSIDVPQAFGDRLVCLALYGSAANEAFIPGRSNVNFAVVLERVTVEDLKRMQRLLPAWHRLGVVTPLLIDLDFLEHARDVFPIELEDIRSSHRVLAGSDVFAQLRIDTTDLRRQLEQEGRSKLLRLRVQYAETAGRSRDVEALILDSVASFLVIARSVLRLDASSAPTEPLLLLDRLETFAGESFAGLRQAAKAKTGESFASGPDAAFGDYLADVERLVRVIDRLPAKPSAQGSASK